MTRELAIELNTNLEIMEIISDANHFHIPSLIPVEMVYLYVATKILKL